MNKFILLFTGLFVVVASLSFGAFGLWSGADITLSFYERLNIIIQLRLPRVLSSIFIGAILSCCGLLMQTLLRNPLACPYTLGISQLVALVFFAVIYLTTKMQVFAALLLIFLFTAIIFYARRQKFKYEFPVATVVLFGLALGSFCSSLILALQFTLDGMSLLQMSRWLMGSMSVTGYDSLPFLLMLTGILAAIIKYFGKDLDCLLLGNEIALSRGVAVKNVNIILHFTVLASVAAVVWFVGPVGFVGLIIPHCVRFLNIKGHQLQAIYCAYIGGIFLCLCDLISRVIFAPVEIPIGVVTGLIGAPCFILLLLKR